MNPRHGSKETAVHGSTNRGAIVTDSRLLRSASARNCRNQAWLLKNSYPRNSLKIKLRWDALQTTISVLVDISYPPNFHCFEQNGVFQQPQAIALKTPSSRVLSEMAILRQLTYRACIAMLSNDPCQF